MKRISSLLIVILILAILGAGFYCWQYAEEYQRLSDKMLPVEAKIVRHEEHEDSEGDITYRAKADYLVDGVYYRNVKVKSNSDLKKLPAVGEVITIMVNPENPGELAEDMHFLAVLFVFPLSVLLACLLTPYNVFWKKRIAVGKRAPGEKDLLEKDIRMRIYTASGRKLALVLGLQVVILQRVYPAVYGPKMYYVVAALGGAVASWRDPRGDLAEKSEKRRLQSGLGDFGG